MPTITIKNLPDNLHKALKSRAKEHGRSLNGEVLSCLKAAVAVTRVDVEKTLASISQARSTDSARITEELLTSALKEGRR